MPVVVFFAPLGAFVITKLPREGIARILYVILIVQFFGAMIVIKPNIYQLLMCVITLVAGLSLFMYLARLKRAVN